MAKAQHIKKERLLDILKNYLEEINIDSEDIGYDTKLLGSNKILDSMDLVQFIVLVEDFIEEEFKIEVTLASEKAMSRRASPFISVETLCNYVNEVLEN